MWRAYIILVQKDDDHISKMCQCSGLHQRTSLKVSAADAEILIALHKNLLSKIRVYISNVSFSRWNRQCQRLKHIMAICGMYVLPQAGLLANELLEKRLNEDDYF